MEGGEIHKPTPTEVSDSYVQNKLNAGIMTGGGASVGAMTGAIAAFILFGPGPHDLITIPVGVAIGAIVGGIAGHLSAKKDQELPGNQH